MSSSVFRILFATDAREMATEQSLHDVATGVSRYVATHPELELSFSGLHYACADEISFSDYRPDGVILVCRRPDDHPALKLKSVKAAVTVNWWEKAKFPSRTVAFMNDDREIARLAADHLTGNRLEHFAYVHVDIETGWARARRTAFVNCIRKAGFSCATLASPAAGDKPPSRDQLLEFLRSLPKPCGIFTPFDFSAKTVLDCCRAGNISVPEQIQVVGVDNNSMICDNSIPTLTSIDVGFTEAGYSAAKRIHRMLLGRKDGRRIVYFKPRAIVARGSSSDIRCIGKSVTAACEFMRVHALEPITPEHVATAVRTPLRSLQMNFRRIRNEGIAEHLRNLRLEHACRLLRETRMPLDQIPSYCCLGNASSAKTLFRRSYGMTMSSYRQNAIHCPSGR